MKLHLTGGQVADVTQALTLLEGFADMGAVLADKAYSAQSVIAAIEQRQAQVVIPPKSSYRKPWDYDKELYKERHGIECFFNRLKQFRRVATRYEKLALHFLAMVMIASLFIWLL